MKFFCEMTYIISCPFLNTQFCPKHVKTEIMAYLGSVCYPSWYGPNVLKISMWIAPFNEAWRPFEKETREVLKLDLAFEVSGNIQKYESRQNTQ